MDIDVAQWVTESESDWQGVTPNRDNSEAMENSSVDIVTPIVYFKHYGMLSTSLQENFQ